MTHSACLLEMSAPRVDLSDSLFWPRRGSRLRAAMPSLIASIQTRGY